MKRSAIVAIIALLAFTPCLLTRAEAGTMIGIKGGLTVSDLWGEDSGGGDMKVGFLGGASFTYMFNENVGIQPEFLFHRKGIKENFLGVEITWNLDYVEIPILFKLAIPTEGSITPSFIVGPALAFNINSTLKGEYLGQTAEEDASEITSDMDFGAVLGFNVGFDAGSVTVIFDARYTLGFMSIDKEGDAEVRNSAFSFMAGVAFPIGGTE